MNNNNLQPHHIQVEYPIDPNAFVKNFHPNSKRDENPQIDLFCSHPDKVITAEFGLFKRNSKPVSSVNATEKVFKMLNDMLRLSLNQIFNPNEAFFICIADAKILGTKMRNNILPRFPAVNYTFNHLDINTWITNSKSAKKIFDKRFVDQANILQLSINAELVFNQIIQNPIHPQLASTNNLQTRALVYKITSKNLVSLHNKLKSNVMI